LRNAIVFLKLSWVLMISEAYHQKFTRLIDAMYNLKAAHCCAEASHIPQPLLPKREKGSRAES